ncbi:acetolactate synthase small subunit [uncultured Rikenella sp.]|uniref:acetolactate synthase small subunit n=1 Tax=uncultured Rikenella sp. TaxID=368003 RepID=UPI002626874F|nr:acetolactate synthase small subunit [uncultured Rikenella sp.]
MAPIKNTDTTVREYIITVFTENQVGVLGRITSIFTRRKINIESLKVSETPVKGISMFTIHAFTTEDMACRILSGIERIIEVLRADKYRTDEFTAQQIALYKVSPELFRKGGDACLREHNARVIEINPAYVVLERTGAKEEIDALRDYLSGSGMLMQFTHSENIVLHDASVENALNEIAGRGSYLGD